MEYEDATDLAGANLVPLDFSGAIGPRGNISLACFEQLLEHAEAVNQENPKVVFFIFGRHKRKPIDDE